MYARSSVDLKQGSSASARLIGLVKVPCFEGTEDCAHPVLKTNGLYLSHHLDHQK